MRLAPRTPQVHLIEGASPQARGGAPTWATIGLTPMRAPLTTLATAQPTQATPTSTEKQVA